MPSVIDVNGKVVREEATPEVFNQEYTDKQHAIFRAVHRELANPRAGTHKTKKRDEVSGGGRKPWRQKGTGRARQGSTRSPQWAHGGVVFGPQPRSYVSSLNKKERRAAMRAALADKFQSNGVTVLDAAVRLAQGRQGRTDHAGRVRAGGVGHGRHVAAPQRCEPRTRRGHPHRR